MSVLNNQRHERFAQELAKGCAADEAYALAGYAANRGNASRLNANESIMKRVEEIQSVAAEEVGVSIQWVLDGLKLNYQRAMQVEEIKNSDGTGTGEFRYEGSVANRALELLGKHLGMFKERVEHSGKVNLAPTLIYENTPGQPRKDDGR